MTAPNDKTALQQWFELVSIILLQVSFLRQPKDPLPRLLGICIRKNSEEIYKFMRQSVSLCSVSWRVNTLPSGPPRPPPLLLLLLLLHFRCLPRSPSLLASSCSSHSSHWHSPASPSFYNGGAASTTPSPAGPWTTTSFRAWLFSAPKPPTRLAPRALIAWIFWVRAARWPSRISGIGSSGTSRIWILRWVSDRNLIEWLLVFWFLVYFG